MILVGLLAANAHICSQSIYHASWRYKLALISELLMSIIICVLMLGLTWIVWSLSSIDVSEDWEQIMKFIVIAIPSVVMIIGLVMLYTIWKSWKAISSNMEIAASNKSMARWLRLKIPHAMWGIFLYKNYSTVTLFARLRGLSTSRPSASAI